jgi:hypothetical protein
LDGTREQELDTAQEWFDVQKGDPVMWLCGLAGIGKSTIARSFCKQLDTAKQLGASFFFNRASEQLRSASHMFATLAYYLAYKHGSYCAYLQDALETQAVPHDFTNQLEKLIVEPLLKSTAPSHPFVIVLDALDECENFTPNSKSLRTLAETIGRLSSHLKFFITSRPELALTNGLKPAKVKPLEINLRGKTNLEDISKYINYAMKEENFNGLKPYPEWPSEEERQKLAEHASGLFMWAYTACKLIQEDHLPKERLDMILQLGQSTDRPEANLHKLYDQTLRIASERTLGGKATNRFCTVLGSLAVLLDPLTLPALEALLPDSNSEDIIRSISHILQVQGSDQSVQAVHPSFYRYLLADAVEPFKVHENEQNASLATRCLNLLRRRHNSPGEGTVRTRQSNPGPVYSNLNDTLEVQHACRFWARYIDRVNLEGMNDTEPVLKAVEEFYRHDLLFWLESMKSSNRHEEAQEQLQQINNKLSGTTALATNHDLLQIMDDALQFVQHFSSKLKTDSHHSALLLTPRRTCLWRCYGEQLSEDDCKSVAPTRTWREFDRVLEGKMMEYNPIPPS